MATARMTTTGHATLTLRRAVLVPVVMLVAAGWYGCSDQRFEQAQAVRQKRIEKIFSALEQREGRSPDSTADIYARIRKAEANNSASLMKSFDRLQFRYRQELERWPERLKKTQQHLELRMRGDPPDIDKTMPKMFY